MAGAAAGANGAPRDRSALLRATCHSLEGFPNAFACSVHELPFLASDTAPTHTSRGARRHSRLR
jgi:hypothetical protein